MPWKNKERATRIERFGKRVKKTAVGNGLSDLSCAMRKFAFSFGRGLLLWRLDRADVNSTICSLPWRIAAALSFFVFFFPLSLSLSLSLKALYVAFEISRYDHTHENFLGLSLPFFTFLSMALIAAAAMNKHTD